MIVKFFQLDNKDNNQEKKTQNLEKIRGFGMQNGINYGDTELKEKQRSKKDVP